MSQFLAYGIIGLSTAAIYAVIGSGLVLTYTTTGVFNFAHGAAGMLAAFTYWQLTIGWGWPVPVALAVVLLVAAPVFGLLVERVVIRPVQGLGEAERLVVTVAMLSGFIALAQWIWNPNLVRALPPFFPGSASLHIGSASLTWQQIITMIVAVAVALGLRLLLYRTRVGTQMRATVDDRALAGLTGADPNRANRSAWILSTQLAAIGGILIAPEVTLDATQLSLLIVSAYTAAVFGRLRNLPMVFVGAVVVGLLQSFLTGYLPQSTTLNGLQVAAPALLLFLALLVFPHGRLRGKSLRLRPVPVPTLRGTAVFAAAIIASGVVLATVLSQPDLITYGAIFSFGLIALSYVPLSGYAGQISLCQLSMAAIGALVWAHLAPNGQWWALIVAVAVAAAAGAIVAVPALRLSGIYLALGTAAFAVILDDWVFSIPAINIGGLHLTLFADGSISAVGPSVFGLHLTSERAIMILAAVLLGLATVGVALLRRGRFGRRLIALRDSEAAYAMLGGNLLLARVAVFALAAGIAGLGGALYAMQQQSITSTQFTFEAGLAIFLIAVVGGVASVGSGFFAGAVLIGPINALVAVAAWATNPISLFPGLAGMAFGRAPDGLVPLMRRDWTPVARYKILVAAAVVIAAALWVLRLAGVVNGWVLFWGVALVAVALRAYAAARTAETPTYAGGSALSATSAGDPSPTSTPGPTPTSSPGPAEDPVPIEWRGLSRPWRAEDEEVLDRAIARG
ncbi:MAG TPA: ABC transporter permease [Trebonia sp.]|jgi:branched-chain amino acid transport system permease protein|nr:ABC transporter permease [Trebonia sp.]